MTMADDSICWMSATELVVAFKRRKVSPVEVVDAVLARIERLNPKLGAYCLVTAESARKEARWAERALMKKGASLGPLHGVPFSVKDTIITKGARTTFGSKLFADHVPEEDAPAVERLKAAGGILVGKTNTPAFGFLGVTHNLLFGATRNPWNLERTPGGSSGGAGAAVAAGMAPLAIGTDGGGSIRIPASFSGIFGLKPSFGRVPVYPFSAAWSVSHVGPMTRTVADAALALSVIAGPDERDVSSLPGERADYVRSLKGSLKGLRVAWSATLGYAVVDSEVLAAAERAARRFKAFGCRLERVDPGFKDPRQAWEIIFCGGIAARLASALPERRADIDPGLVKLIEEGLTWPATKFVQAWFDRLQFCDLARKFFTKYDLLLTPTLACPPFPVGMEGPGTIDGKPVSTYAWIPFTFPFNLTGQPACTVPCGFTRDGLPIGLQIVGRRFDDATVLQAAALFEAAGPWAATRPPVS
jgi:aspartyl-tRNA(Asn)/glutamyl-tRNA(Gln) amidotransferase subunit A